MDLYAIVERRKKEIKDKRDAELKEYKKSREFKTFAIFLDGDFYKAFSRLKDRENHYKTNKFRELSYNKDITFVKLKNEYKCLPKDWLKDLENLKSNNTNIENGLQSS